MSKILKFYSRYADISKKYGSSSLNYTRNLPMDTRYFASTGTTVLEKKDHEQSQAYHGFCLYPGCWKKNHTL